MVRAPLISGILILSEHSFSGTRRVHHDPIKKLWKRRCKLKRIHVRHHRISDTEALDILGQDLCPGRMDLIADQKPLSAHFSRKMGGFSSGCRTEIQNPLPGLWG